ncbi:MerR family DNA-binding transcriptional regulator [Pontiellaceae bacterium B12227]|nr:MerR family DNA-binding transcriptional regulator [Pontiellaceae bacterium B12227]
MKQMTLDLITNVLSTDDTVSQDEFADILKQLKVVMRGKKPRPGTIKQAAELLDVQPITIRRYAKAGLLHPIRITARKIRYDLNEVEELATSGIRQ